MSLSGDSGDTFRDHMLFLMSLGTGLRIHEVVALNCGQVFTRAGGGRARIVLEVFKRSSDDVLQEVTAPDALRHKLKKLRGWKRRRGQSVELDAPLFVARGGRRLSQRQLTRIFADWRQRAELADGLTYHNLRHTFCQRLYELKRDVLIVKKAARHSHVMTSTLYAQPTLDDVARATAGMEL